MSRSTAEACAVPFEAVPPAQRSVATCRSPVRPRAAPRGLPRPPPAATGEAAAPILRPGPLKGVRLVSCWAAKRLSTELARSAFQARTASALPLRSRGPRSCNSKRLPRSFRVLSAMTTVFGSAIPCRRAATFGVSPTIPRSCASPDPIKSPTTTKPVAMPTRV